MKKLTKQILKEMVLKELSSVDLLSEMRQKDANRILANPQNYKSDVVFATIEWLQDHGQADAAAKLRFDYQSVQKQSVTKPSEEEVTFALSPQHQGQKLRSDKKKLKIANKELKIAQETHQMAVDMLKSCQEEDDCNPGEAEELTEEIEDATKDISALLAKIEDIKDEIGTGAAIVKKIRGKRRIGLRRKYPLPTKDAFELRKGKVYTKFEDFYKDVGKNPEAAKALCRFRGGRCRLRNGGRDKVWGRSHWEAWGILTQPKVTAAEPAVAAEPAAGTRRKREPLATAKKNYDFSEYDKFLATATSDRKQMWYTELKKLKKKGTTRPENTEYLNALIKHVEENWNDATKSKTSPTGIPTADVKGDTTFDK